MNNEVPTQDSDNIRSELKNLSNEELMDMFASIFSRMNFEEACKGTEPEIQRLLTALIPNPNLNNQRIYKSLDMDYPANIGLHNEAFRTVIRSKLKTKGGAEKDDDYLVIAAVKKFSELIREATPSILEGGQKEFFEFVISAIESALEYANDQNNLSTVGPAQSNKDEA